MSTVAGHTYELSFAMAGNPNGDPVVKTLTAGFESVGAPYRFDTTDRSNGDLGWTRNSLRAPACASSAVVELRSTSPGNRGPNVDDIRLKDVGPSPAGACDKLGPDPKPTAKKQTIRVPEPVRAGRSVRVAGKTGQGAKWVSSTRKIRVRATKESVRLVALRTGKCRLKVSAKVVPGFRRLRIRATFTIKRSARRSNVSRRHRR